MPVEVVNGLRLLGQPLGSKDYTATFLVQKMEENVRDAKLILCAISNRHTTLALFVQCTLHKSLGLKSCTAGNPSKGTGGTIGKAHWCCLLWT